MTAIHPNSAAAYAATSAERSDLETRILALMADGVARSDRQIQHELGHPEPIRPRVFKLVETGQLFEVGSIKCGWTGKTVRVTKRFL